MNPVIIRALQLLPVLKKQLPQVMSYLNTSGISEQVNAGGNLKTIMEEIPDESAIAAIVRRTNVYNSVRNEAILPIKEGRKVTVAEYLIAWNYIQLSAVFGAQAAETYADSMPGSSGQIFLNRNRTALMAVTFDGFIAALTIFNNQIKPNNVYAQMCISYTALSQVCMAQQKLDISKGQTVMMKPTDMLKGVKEPNYFFSKKTADDKQNQSYFATFSDAFDWFEQKTNDAAQYVVNLVAKEDVSKTVNFGELDGTVNTYGFNPDSPEDLADTFDYLFYTVLKVRII